MKRAWKVLLAGVILSAVLFPGMAAAQGGSIQFSKAGDIVTISGGTNLAVGDKLIVTVVSAAFTPTVKGAGGGFSGAGGTVLVEAGSPLNTFAFDVNVSTFPPGEYLVTVESVETGLRESGQFALPWTPVTAQVTLTPAPGTTPVPVSSASPTPAVPAQTTTPALVPLPGIMPAAALVLAIGILVLRRKS